MKRLFLTTAISFWALTMIAQQPPTVDHNHMDHNAMMGQHDHQAPMDPRCPLATTAQSNPYAGTAVGLTDAQRAQYLNGEGMGLAKPAEMNHYPGPRHVLQNAERLKLSPEQEAATQKLFDNVQLTAKALGRKIVDREDELLRIFSSGTADAARVKQLTTEIGNLEGELRATHLTAHLQERSLLFPEQVQIYDQLRDYIPGERPAPASHQH